MAFFPAAHPLWLIFNTQFQCFQYSFSILSRLTALHTLAVTTLYNNLISVQLITNINNKVPFPTFTWDVNLLHFNHLHKFSFSDFFSLLTFPTKLFIPTGKINIDLLPL